MKALIPLALLLSLAAAAADLPEGATYENSLGIALVRIEPGVFQMGAEAKEIDASLYEEQADQGRDKPWLPKHGDFDEHPAHEVRLTTPFFMGVTEVTNAQYERFRPLHMHERGKRGFSLDNDEAVVYVSWEDATAFCAWLSEKEGLPYRLPTEAEWEYACRAGTATAFNTGDALPRAYSKNPINSWFPCPLRSKGRDEIVSLKVAQRPPNAWGLHDMHGNVEEWCYDYYGPYPEGAQTDPLGYGQGDFRVTRGGSHGTPTYYLRSANRMGALPTDQHWMIGFRVVLGAMPAGEALPALPPPAWAQAVEQVDRRHRTPPVPMDTPYFADPIPYVKIPENSEGPLFSRHNHDPGLVECPNGDMFAIWYTTVTEKGREVAQAASRLPFGAAAWQPAAPFWDAPDRNDHCPAMFFDGNETLYHFSGLASAATWGPLAIIMRSSKDNGASWTPARLIVPEHQRRNQCVESVFTAADGSWILPCDASPAGDGGTAIHISTDQGATWRDPGGTIAGIHAAVTQLGDGRLFALGRGDTIADHMPQSISGDRGRTWQYAPSPFPPIASCQRLVLLRLQEGPLLLIAFANKGPVKVIAKDASGKEHTLEGMYAALSYDDATTWPVIRPMSHTAAAREYQAMDGRPFTMARTTAEPNGYLSICQGADGIIHLISSMNHYRFNLKWIETPIPAE